MRRRSEPGRAPRRRRRRAWLVAALLLVAVAVIVFDLRRVRGDSMAPTLVGAGDGVDRVVIDTTRYWWRAPARWELAVHAPSDESALRVKRVVGLPGEEIAIRDGDVLVSGVRLVKPWVVYDAVAVPVFDTRETAIDSPAFAEDWFVDNAAVDGVRVRAVDVDQPATITARAEVTDAIGGFRGGDHAVGDLELTLDVRAESDAGTLALILGDRSFRARLVLAPGGAARLEIDGAVVARAAVRPIGGRLARVGLSAIDGRLRCVVDGVVIAEAAEPSPPRVGQSGRANGVGIAWSGPEPMALERLRLRRDVHYVSDGFGGTRVCRVPPGHCFLLGDNSRRSEDSRVWGPVPVEQLVGVAVGILWPPARLRLL